MAAFSRFLYTFMTTPVAIIGFACRLAGAGTSAELWARLNNGLDSNALAGSNGTPYTPEEQLAGQFPGQSFAPGFRWPASLLKQVEIDPADFGMAPETARELDSLPLLGMSLVREALSHAAAFGASGSTGGSGATAQIAQGASLAGGLPCAEERAGLVLGFSHSVRSTALPTYAAVAAAVTENGGSGVPSGGDSASSSSLLTSNQNSGATAASDNEAAVQMIAQTMGLRGLHGAVDSGPTAGLAAIQLAVDELESGRCDLMVAGGIQLLADAERQALVDAAGAAALAAVQAQQAGGAPPAPFGGGGGGQGWGHSTLPTEQEGLAVVVLKRLSEAHRDGDRVWGVIRGASSASQTDGTGRSRIIAAALKAWQAACQEGGLRPDGVEFVEVQTAMPGAEVVPMAWMGWHGLAAATENAPRCVVATPAPLYSRLGAAMGVCGLIRLALSLHHKLLPAGAFSASTAAKTPSVPVAPHTSGGLPPSASQSLAGILAANVTVTASDSSASSRPWFSVPGRERLAGLWSHNPNGTHYCFVLEESHPARSEPVRADSVEIFAFSAKSSRPLITQLKELDKAFNQGLTAQALAQRAADSRLQFSRQHQNRLVFVSRDARELRRQLRIALEFLPANPAESWALPENIFHGYGPPPGRVAMLFPDVGAASTGMAANAVCTFPVAFDVIGHTELQTGVESPLLADRIFPWPTPPAMEGHSTSRSHSHQSGKPPGGLSSPDTAQPAVTVASLAMLGMLQQFEVDANAVAGAGCGELAALAAAGCFDRATLLFLAAMRGRCLTEFHLMHDLNEPGAALSIRAPLETIRRVLREERLNLGLRQQQTAWIVFGPRPEVLRAQRICLQRAIVSDEVPLASLPNAAQEAPMRALWHRNVESLDIAPPRVAVYAPSRSGVMPLPEDSTQLRQHLLGQAVESGTLREAIRQLYQDGTRIFLEIGPGTTLTREVREELGEHPHAAISLEAEDPAPQELKSFPGGMIPLARALAQLAALGSHVRLELWPSPSHPALFHDVTQIRPTIPGRLLVPLIQLPPGAVPTPPGRAGGRSRQDGARRTNGSAGDSNGGSNVRNAPPPPQAAPYYAHPHQIPHPISIAQLPTLPAAGTLPVPGALEIPGTFHVSPEPGHVTAVPLASSHPVPLPPRDAADILLEREYAATHETLRQLHAHTAEMFKQFLANQEAAQRAVQELYRARVQQIEAQRTAAAMEQARAEQAGESESETEEEDGLQSNEAEGNASEQAVVHESSRERVATSDADAKAESDVDLEEEEDAEDEGTANGNAGDEAFAYDDDSEDEDTENAEHDDAGNGPDADGDDEAVIASPEAVETGTSPHSEVREEILEEPSPVEAVHAQSEDPGNKEEDGTDDAPLNPPEFCDIVVDDFLDLLAVECDYPREFLDDELTLDEDLGVDAPRLEQVWQNLLLRHPAAQRPPPASEISGARLGQVSEVLRALNMAASAEILPVEPDSDSYEVPDPKADSDAVPVDATSSGTVAGDGLRDDGPESYSGPAIAPTEQAPLEEILNVPESGDTAPETGPIAHTSEEISPASVPVPVARPNAIAKPFTISPFLNVLPSPAPRYAPSGGQGSGNSGGGTEQEPPPVRRPRPTAPVGGMVRSPASSLSTAGGTGGNSSAGSAGMNLGPRLHIGVALGLALVMERDLSLATHPFLRSHVLRDRPVLPLSVGLNWMAEAALRHSPEMVLHGCRNFRALRPVALDDMASDTSSLSHNGYGNGNGSSGDTDGDARHRGLRLRLAAGAAQRKSNGLYEVPVELQSEQEQAYYRATMLLSQAPPPQAPVPLLPNLAARPYPRTVREAMDTLLFHGPDFHGIESIHGLGPRGISGSIRPSPDPTAWMTAPASTHWHADPLLLEGSVQLLMLWSIENLQAPCLPSRYGAVRVYRPPLEQGAYATEVMIRAYDRTHIACDVYFSDSTGRPIMTVEDMDCSVDRGYAAAFGKS